ncbi:cytoplasm protein [Pseudozyma hubeiensis SY62]|uniref:Cytoplasm protein n=1 Tax=Pseudozyma hubeiensis (strain SY62) TaxID=1305764 RepID=R9PK32_PSEHS|nr:cytoplasm protein [Pseudozyma hubeiensis SY62]GAC98465.1 cytoplasm protein [Pseudozyma hubeiensis SY62]
MSEADSGPASVSPDPLTPPHTALHWTSYGTWYPIFRKHAPKSTVIDIPSTQPELLDWLDSGTFVLPDGSGPSTITATTSATISSVSSHSSFSDSDEEEPEQALSLPKLDAAIRDVISKYSGPVFPKLNYSAPLDAGFMLPGNSLQCYHPEDVYLLLKSSEFVGRDLEQLSHLFRTSSQQAPTPQLVLKKWFSLNKSYEFRCFVRSNSLIAISQRDVTFYEHLQSSQLQQQISDKIEEFWEDELVEEERWGLRDYIFDVYLTKDLGRVWLIDVNAWLPRTDPLLFAWEDLDELHLREKAGRSQKSLTQDEPEDGVVRLNLHPSPADFAPQVNRPQLRILHDRRMQSSGGTGATYSSNMVPKDLVEFAKTRGDDTTAIPGGTDMSVDQIVKRWNDKVDLEDKSAQQEDV